jgi:hypothetical protein
MMGTNGQADLVDGDSFAPGPSAGVIPRIEVLRINERDQTATVRLSCYRAFLLQTGTPIDEADAAANFAFAVGDYNRDGVPDVYCLKRTNTGTGTLEVHVLNGADNYQSFLLQTGTPIDEADAAANFAFAVGDYNRDGVPDVYCLKRTNTGTGTLEVHVVDGNP